MTEEEFEEVKLPKELVEKLRKHGKEAGASSVSSYITYILKQVVAKLEGEKTTPGDEEVEKELKAMGYLE